MQQPQTLSSLITTATTRQPSNCDNRQLPTSQAASRKTEIIRHRFGTKEEFLMKANPDVQSLFAKNPQTAVMGDYPTLTDINIAYGKDFADLWLMPQITNLAAYTGAKNLTLDQERDLARVIATEYHYFKITELLVFFHRFKAGRYGRFYGSVDPMVITCALREFRRERNDLIGLYEQQRREEEESEYNKAHPPMTRDEWIEVKTIIAMYNSDYTV